MTSSLFHFVSHGNPLLIAARAKVEVKPTNINGVETIPEGVGPVGVGDSVRHDSGGNYLGLSCGKRVSKDGRDRSKMNDSFVVG